jgi:hypothetical protein
MINNQIPFVRTQCAGRYCLEETISVYLASLKKYISNWCNLTRPEGHTYLLRCNVEPSGYTHTPRLYQHHGFFSLDHFFFLDLSALFSPRIFKNLKWEWPVGVQLIANWGWVQGLIIVAVFNKCITPGNVMYQRMEFRNTDLHEPQLRISQFTCFLPRDVGGSSLPPSL